MLNLFRINAESLPVGWALSTTTIRVASKVGICVSPVNTGLVVQNMSQIGYCSVCKKQPNCGGILSIVQKYYQNATCIETLRLAVTKRKMQWGWHTLNRMVKILFFVECGVDLSAFGELGHGIFSASFEIQPKQ